MIYRAYPEYKSSGIDWLGEIPSHWSILQLRRVIKQFVDYRGRTPNKVESGVRLITAKNIKGGKIDQSLSEEYMDEDEYLGWMVRGWPEIGDVVVTTEAPLGEAAQITDPAIALAQRVILFKTIQYDIINDYLKYYFLSDFGQGELWSRATGSTALGIKADRLKSVIISLPPIDEQHKIALFIDSKVEHIDALITKKEQQIELLQEKRAALISHVVTKGLNPNAKMKDSGVEWLRGIPEHWDLKRLKYLFVIKKRIAGTEGFDVLSITQQGIKIKDIESNDGQLSMDYSKYQFVEIGDFAMNHMDLLTGYVDISNYNGVTSPDYRVFTIKNSNKSISRYNLYLLQMCYQQKIFYAFGQGVSIFGRWRLPTEQFNNFIFPIPPISEQKAIADFLDKETGKIVKLIRKIETTIDKLKEYRTALISAVVTGKIDVRKEVA